MGWQRRVGRGEGCEARRRERVGRGPPGRLGRVGRVSRPPLPLLLLLLLRWLLLRMRMPPVDLGKRVVGAGVDGGRGGRAPCWPATGGLAGRRPADRSDKEV